MVSKNGIVITIIWAVLTAAGETLVLVLHPFPVGVSAESTIVDWAFEFLTILAIPVVMFVITMLIYSAIKFRHKGPPNEDGPPIRTNGTIVGAWLIITTALTVFMIIQPGILGLNELHARSHEPVDLVIQAESSQYLWKLTYPEQNVTTFTEIVLPVGKHVRFDVTSTDVIHAFWIPAFRGKIDAVPGLTTAVHVTPTETGSFEDDPGLRLQCAELCGVGHGIMRVPVRVVEQAEFDAWVTANSGK